MRTAPLVAALALAFASAPAGARPAAPVLDHGFSATAAPALSGGRASARPPSRKRPPPRAVRPDPRRALLGKPNPLNVGLAAAGASAGTALVGGGIAGVSAIVLLGAFGTPALPVTVTAAVLAIAAGVATPFLAGFAAGAAVLAMDPRSDAKAWSGLWGCATSGCCLGADLVGNTVLGNACNGVQVPGLPNPKAPKIPGPDEPAQWTAGAGIAGLVGGAALGALLGWSVAPTPSDPYVPVAIGAMSGAVVGAGLAAGVGAGLAEGIRK